jgi:hypothetical protein
MNDWKIIWGAWVLKRIAPTLHAQVQTDRLKPIPSSRYSSASAVPRNPIRIVNPKMTFPASFEVIRDKCQGL